MAMYGTFFVGVVVVILGSAIINKRAKKA